MQLAESKGIAVLLLELKINMALVRQLPAFILPASDAPEMRNGFAMLPAVASRRTFS